MRQREKNDEKKCKQNRTLSKTVHLSGCLRMSSPNKGTKILLKKSREPFIAKKKYTSRENFDKRCENIKPHVPSPEVLLVPQNLVEQEYLIVEPAFEVNGWAPERRTMVTRSQS